MTSSQTRKQLHNRLMLNTEYLNTEPNTRKHGLLNTEQKLLLPSKNANHQFISELNQGFIKKKNCVANNPIENQEYNTYINLNPQSSCGVQKELDNENNKDFIQRTVAEIVSKELSKQSKSKYNNDSAILINSSNSQAVPRLIDETKVLNFELEQIKQDNITLRNDNIILREDVNRLSEICSCLESELEFSRRKK